MKNPIIIFALFTVVVILGIGAYTLSQKSDSEQSMTNVDDASMNPTGAMMQKDENTTESNEMMNTSGYVQYSKSALESTSNNRRILFFYASWCPTCRPADTSFTQNENRIPDGLTVIRVNYNDPDTDQDERDLAKKYGVTYQHTFVQIDSQGTEVTKWNGGDIDELLSNSK